MRLLIRSLMSRLRLASKLYPGPKRWIFDAFEINNPPRKMTRTPRTLKKISFLRILLLICHQVRPNPHQHSLKTIRTVVFAKKDLNDKAKTRILLPLVSTLLLSRKTRAKIRTKKTYPIFSATLVSKKVIMPINILRRSQKTCTGLDDLYVIDWG